MNNNSRKRPIASIEELLQKEHKFISSEEALRDVIPPQWSEDVLSGGRKIVIGTEASFTTIS